MRSEVVAVDHVLVGGVRIQARLHNLVPPKISLAGPKLLQGLDVQVKGIESCSGR